jgi:hypothetical protein
MAMTLGSLLAPILACALVSYLAVARSWGAKKGSIALGCAVLLNVALITARYLWRP